MAKIYNAPSNPFRRAIARGIASPHLQTPKTGSTKTAQAGAASQGALGDPSLYQSYSGPGAGFAQFGQTLAQHRAYEKDQDALNEAMDDLGKRISGGAAPEKAFLEMLGENPGHFNTLSNAGVLQNTAALGQWMQQAQMASQVGKVQQFDLGGGNKIAQVIGPDGKPHYMNIPNPSAYPHNLNMTDENNNPLIGTRSGGVQPVPGASNTSTINKVLGNDAAAARQDKSIGAADARQQQSLMKPHWDSQNNRWVYPPASSGAQSNAGQAVQAPTAEVKLNDRDKSFFGSAPGLYKSLGDLADLSGAVAGPIAGKIKTLSGKILGENEAAIAWNSALKNAENTLTSMRDSGGYVYGLKEKLANLPRDWQAARQIKTDMAQWQQTLQRQAGVVAAANERQGLVLPDTVANELATMGIFSQKFAPAMNKVRQSPETLTRDEINSLVDYGPNMSKQERDTLEQEIIKRAAATANQATQGGIPLGEEQ